MRFIFRLAFLFMSLVCAAAAETKSILAVLINIPHAASLRFQRALCFLASATEGMKTWLQANTSVALILLFKKSLIICLVSSALLTIIVIGLRSQYVGIKWYGLIDRNSERELSKPLNQAPTISQASTPASEIPETNRELPVTIAGSVGTIDSQDQDSYRLVGGPPPKTLKGILVDNGLQEQLDESLITAKPKTDTVLRYVDFKLPGRNKGGRTGIRRNADGKVSTCSVYPADEKTQVILAESFTRSVKIDKSLEAWKSQDLNTVADNEQLEFFTIEGLRTFVETNREASSTSFTSADQRPSRLHLSQCIKYFMRMFPFVKDHKTLLNQLQAVVKHAQGMAIRCQTSSQSSAAGFLALELRLATFMETKIRIPLRNYKKFDELDFCELLDSGASGKWKRAMSGHTIRKLVRHIWDEVHVAQDRRSELLEEFADLMTDYYKLARKSKGLRVEEEACSKVKNVFHQASSKS